MNNGIFFSTLIAGLFSISLANADGLSVCEKKIQLTEKKIKKSFDLLWQDVDSSVGVEFFLLVLKGNERMPASNVESSAIFYTKLLSGMKKTSKELSDHGAQFDAKILKRTEDLIAQLEKAEKCSQLVTKK